MRIPFAFLAPGSSDSGDTVGLPNLQLWYRPDLSALTFGTGSKIATLNNKAPVVDANRNLAQATGSKQPTLNTADAAYNGKNTMSFVRANDTQLLSPTWAAAVANPQTLYVVANSDGASFGYEDLFDGSDGTGDRVQIAYASTLWGISSGGVGIIPSTNTSSSPQIFCYVSNGASSKFFISSATEEVMPSTPSASPIQVAVLGNTKTFGFGLTGKIGEVRLYSGAHGSTDRATVLASLSSRYAIATGDTYLRFTFEESALPLANHPVGGGSAVSIPNHSGTTPTLSGGEMTFNGANNVYSADSPYRGPASKTVTYLAWVYPTSLTGDQCCVAKQYRGYNASWASPYLSWYIGLDASGAGNWIVFISTSGFNSIVVSTAGYKVVINQWNLIGFTLNHGVFTPYFNGTVAPGALTLGDLAIDTSAGGPYVFGGAGVGGVLSSMYTGKIAEVRGYNVALSTSDILAIYNAGPPSP